MKHNPTRVVIYVKDIMNITGRKLRSSYSLMSKIRKQNGKGRGEFITVDEFCAYTGFTQQQIKPFLE
jgi:hypothetical protein